MQAISTGNGPSFNSSVLRTVTEDLGRRKFTLESITDTVVLFRKDEQYIKFTLKDGNLYTRIGVGHPDRGEDIKSMRLDELIGFNYSGLKRGLIKTENRGVRECLAMAVRDLWEFAGDFMNGDFRAFFRIAALKYRDEHGMLRENVILGTEKKPA